MNFSFWQKLLSWVRVRRTVGGLEVSDSALRYAKWKGTAWETVALRLPPGILQEGRIKDVGALRSALAELRLQIGGSARRRKGIDTVVSMTSLGVYSQVFNLPRLQGQSLSKAIKLNLEMVAPDKSKPTYSSSQVLGESKDGGSLEILAVFAAKEAVDELLAALRAENFFAHSLEFRALGLVRAARTLGTGIDPAGSCLILVVDEEGVEFVLFRGGRFYFEYRVTWREVLGENREIAPDKFRETLLHSFNQVVNFYASHWNEPLAGVWVAAGGLADTVIGILGESSKIPLRTFAFEGLTLGSEWLAALGSGVRGVYPPEEDEEISLLGVSAQEEFRERQLLGFFGFWNVLLPAALALLLVAILAANIFLRQTNEQLVRTEAVRSGPAETEELRKLEARVTDFNRSVSLLSTAIAANPPKFPGVDGLMTQMDAYGITFSRIEVGPDGATRLAAQAGSEEGIRDFAAALGKEKRFSNINLPLSEIRNTAQGLSFSMTLSIALTTD